MIEKSELETEKLSTVTEIVSTMIHETWDYLKLVKLCNSTTKKLIFGAKIQNSEFSGIEEMEDNTCHCQL